MRIANEYGVCQSGCAPYPVLTGTAGNPELRPFRANAADLSFEKYLGHQGLYCRFSSSTNISIHSSSSRTCLMFRSITRAPDPVAVADDRSERAELPSATRDHERLHQTALQRQRRQDVWRRIGRNASVWRFRFRARWLRPDRRCRLDPVRRSAHLRRRSSTDAARAIQNG